MQKILSKLNITILNKDRISITDIYFAFGSNMAYINTGDENLMKEFGI